MQMRDLVKRLDSLSEAPLPTGTMPVALDLKSLDDLKRTNQNLYKQILQNNPQLAMADVGVSVNNQQVPATGGTPATGNQQQTAQAQTTAVAKTAQAQQVQNTQEPEQTTAPGQQPIGKNSSSQIPPPVQKRPQEGFEKFSEELDDLMESLLSEEEETPRKDYRGVEIPPGQTFPNASFGDYMKVTGGLTPRTGDRTKRFDYTQQLDDLPKDADNWGKLGAVAWPLTRDVASTFYTNPLKGLPTAVSTWGSKSPSEAEFGQDTWNVSARKHGEVIDAKKRVDQPGTYNPGDFYEPIATSATNYLAGTGAYQGGKAVVKKGVEKFGDWRSNVNMSKSQMDALIMQGADKLEKDWIKDPANKGQVRPTARDFYNQSKKELSTKLADTKRSNKEKIELSKERGVPEPKGVRDPIKLTPKDIGGRKSVVVNPDQIDALEKSAKWDPKLKPETPKTSFLSKLKPGGIKGFLGKSALGAGLLTLAGAAADQTAGDAGTTMMTQRNDEPREKTAREKALDRLRGKDSSNESFESFLNDMNQLTEELIQEDWKDDTKKWMSDTGKTLSDPQTYVNAAKSVANAGNTLSRNALTAGGVINQPLDAIEAGTNYLIKKATGKPTTFSQEYKDSNARTQDAVNATNAFSRSALNSLTFNNYDRAEAGLEYALDKAIGNDPKWVDDKGEGKLNRAYARSDQAIKDYPRASVAGDVAGDFVPFGAGYKAVGYGIKQGIKHVPKAVSNIAGKNAVTRGTATAAGEITKVGGGMAADAATDKAISVLDPSNPKNFEESLERILALTKGTTK